jgi:hypothetical protein
LDSSDQPYTASPEWDRERQASLCCIRINVLLKILVSPPYEGNLR